jgi:hypothetical protein
MNDFFTWWTTIHVSQNVNLIMSLVIFVGLFLIHFTVLIATNRHPHSTSPFLVTTPSCPCLSPYCCRLVTHFSLYIFIAQRKISMMDSNEYSAYEDSYNDYIGGGGHVADHVDEYEDGLLVIPGKESSGQGGVVDTINFDDPKIANLPRVLLMGPRRGGKTSIQVRFVQ